MAHPILSYHQEQTHRWVDLLAELARHESPTSDKAAVDRCGRFLQQQLQAAGARVDVLPQEEYGDFLRAEFGSGTEGQILLLCHFDTVWPVGQMASMPVVEKDGKLYGPGTYDMKCGVMYTLAALSALRDLGLQSKRKLVLLYTTDEEVGSPTSRSVIEAEALKSEVVLVLEPTVPPVGAVKTARKGVGRFRVHVAGRPSHSGADHRAGVSAVEELARQTLVLQGLTDYERGTTVNVGVVQGGTRANVVAAEASCEIDVRVVTRAEGERVTQAILGLTPFHPEAVLTVTGRMNRPPMERSEAIVKLYQQARTIAASLGFDLPEGDSGGGSDGNFTAALGVPTLDGLGAMGNGAHAFNEHVELEQIPQRVALLTQLLLTL